MSFTRVIHAKFGSIWLKSSLVNIELCREQIDRFYAFLQHYSRLRKVWRYQSGNQTPNIEEEQTVQWPKDNDLQSPIQKTKDRHEPHQNRGWTQVLRKGRQFLLHILQCCVYPSLRNVCVIASYWNVRYLLLDFVDFNTMHNLCKDQRTIRKI